MVFLKKVINKNGKIEFLRFFFCLMILFFHAGKAVFGTPDMTKVSISFFWHGAIAVEFFFLVSGYLMAKNAYKKQKDLSKTSITKESIKFIYNKYKSIFFYHILAFIFAFIVYSFIYAESIFDPIRYLVESIPSILLIQMSGVPGLWINHIEWYISAMMISMMFLYPIILKYYNKFIKIIAPVISVVLLAGMFYATGKLTGVKTMIFFVYKSLFRAIADIAIGAIIFEIVRILNKRKFTKKQKILLTIIEFLSYLGIVLFIIFTLPYEFEFIALALCAVGVTLSFSDITYGQDEFNKEFIYKLGSYSLPIYLCQLPIINLVSKYIVNHSSVVKISAIVFGTFILAFICVQIKNTYDKLKFKRMNKKRK